MPAQDFLSLFQSGVEEGRAETKKARANQALMTMLQGLSDAMKPRTETVVPEIPGPMPAAMPEVTLGMPTAGGGAGSGVPSLVSPEAPQTAQFFPTIPEPTTRTVIPTREDFLSSLLTVISSMPPDAAGPAEAANLARTLFPKYLEPEKDPANRYKTVSQGARLVDTETGSVVAEGNPKPAPMDRNWRTFTDSTGRVRAVHLVSGETKDFGSIAAPKDGKWSYGVDDRGNLVGVNPDTGEQQVFSGVTPTAMANTRLQGENRKKTLDQIKTVENLATQLTQKKFGGQELTRDEMQFLQQYWKVKERMGTFQMLMQQSGDMPQAPQMWWNEGSGAPAPAVPGPAAEDSGILDALAGFAQKLIGGKAGSETPPAPGSPFSPVPPAVRKDAPAAGESRKDTPEGGSRKWYAIDTMDETLMAPSGWTEGDVRKVIQKYNEALKAGKDPKALKKKLADLGWTSSPRRGK